MNLVFSAGELSRRVRFESADWGARVRVRLGDRLHTWMNGGADAGSIADACIAEFGEEAAWHAARKIAELLEWDDHQGARVWTEVLSIIQERSRARESIDA